MIIFFEIAGDFEPSERCPQREFHLDVRVIPRVGECVRVGSALYNVTNVEHSLTLNPAGSSTTVTLLRQRIGTRPVRF